MRNHVVVEVNMFVAEFALFSPEAEQVGAEQLECGTKDRSPTSRGGGSSSYMQLPPNCWRMMIKLNMLDDSPKIHRNYSDSQLKNVPTRDIAITKQNLGATMGRYFTCAKADGSCYLIPGRIST